jgi:lipoprotein LprG
MSRGTRSVAAALLLVALTSCGDDAEPEGEPMAANIATIQRAAAASMGEVTSVKFHLIRSGAPVFIDEVEALALDEAEGFYVAPSSAEAVLTVTVDGSLKTQLGAKALDGEIWMTDPITGRFKPLDSSIDIDPTTFFDPVNGWRPLLAELEDATLVGEEDRDGVRYHIRGTAPADRMEAITAGLVDQELTIDFWVRRDTGLVTATEFSTTFEGETTDWVLELEDYGEEFEIEPPDLDG